jgi:uncharacterized membrane protein
MVLWIYSNLKKQSEKTWKRIFGVSLLLTIFTSISYFTGPATADHVKTILQNYPQDLVENHALWGRIAYILQVFSGLISITGLSSLFQDEKPSPKLPLILLIINLISVLILIYTAHLGGIIRRPDLL